MSKYIAEKLEKGHVLATSPEFATFAEAVRWSVAQGDGGYHAGPSRIAPWASAPFVDGDSEAVVWFEVRSGQVVRPDRSDWESVLRGGSLLSRFACPIPRRVTLWVIDPGDLSSQGCFRDPGTCLSKAPLPGDRILDTLTVELDRRRGLLLRSRRQEEDQYDWTEAGPRFNQERKGLTLVSISGRASGWGSLGDDSYDPGSADLILSKILCEAVLGTGDWEIAPIYYETKEVEVTEAGPWPDDPVAVVGMADFVAADHWRTRRLAEISREEDLRPIRILEEGK